MSRRTIGFSKIVASVHVRRVSHCALAFGIVSLLSLLSLFSTMAFAEAEGAAAPHEAAGIPMSVTWQAINFAIYVGVLVYYLRHPIRNFFSAREEAYKAALIRGEQARLDAERKKREIEDRLSKLETSSDQALRDAKAEAAQLVSQIHQQGQELSKRLREDANRLANLEIERAKVELRTEMLTQALALSRKMLEDKDKMKETDQKRLQTEFVDKIQEVH